MHRVAIQWEMIISKVKIFLQQFKDGGHPFSNQPGFGQNLVYYVIIV